MYDPRLYGSDPEENIVAVNLIEDDREGGARVRIFKRENDVVSYYDQQLHPFIFVNNPDVMFGVAPDAHRMWKLAGSNNFDHLVVFDYYGAKREALKKIRNQSWVKGQHHYDDVYYLRRPEYDYLTHSGKTLFKGMNFTNIYRMQIDIEVFSEGNFPSADREEDEIIIIAISDNKGWKCLLHTNQEYNPEFGESYEYEHQLIDRLIEIINEKDPDIIEGHNILGFDFPYIFKRASMYGIEVSIGRDGSIPYAYESSQKFAERVVEFVDYEIIGRYVIDTYLQVMAFDVFARSLQGYGLKDVAKQFGFAREGRVYIEGDEISNVWQTDPKKLLDYALDDVDETSKIAAHLGQSTFYLTQMIPMPYDRVSRSGPATKIEALFVRWYLKNKHSLPSQDKGSMTVGGYTDVFYTGVYGPIVYADVESLYPSIMLNYEVVPRGDDLGIFQELLQMLTDLRFESKHARKKYKEDSVEYAELDARQSSYKTLINSFYGMLGFINAIFNDFFQADRVTGKGQELLRQLIGIIESDGGIVIEADTDGVLFIPPPNVTTGPNIPEDAELPDHIYVKNLTNRMPPGIVVGFDGRAEKMLSYKRKNYAILGYDGKLKVKGSSLVSRSIEGFGRKFVKEIIIALLNEDVQKMHEIYLSYYNALIERRMEPKDFIRRETLKDSPEIYIGKTRRGERNLSASYELAIKRYEEGGPEPKKGDRIHYYVAGNEKNIKVFEAAKLESDYNKDENTLFYLKRLDEFAAKFAMFFDPVSFRMIFGPDTLYEFKTGEYKIISTKVENQEDSEEDEDDTPF